MVAWQSLCAGILDLRGFADRQRKLLEDGLGTMLAPLPDTKRSSLLDHLIANVAAAAGGSLEEQVRALQVPLIEAINEEVLRRKATGSPLESNRIYQRGPTVGGPLDPPE